MKKEPFLIDVYEGEFENFVTDFSEYEVVEYEQEDYTFNENDIIPPKQSDVEEKKDLIEQEHLVDFIKNKEWNESLDEKQEQEDYKNKTNAQLTEIINKLSKMLEILDSVFKYDF